MQRLRKLEDHLRPLQQIGLSYWVGVVALLALIGYAVYVYLTQQLRLGLGGFWRWPSPCWGTFSSPSCSR